MTRFQMELSGKLGQFWQNEAKKELERVKSDLDPCKIIIDRFDKGKFRGCTKCLFYHGLKHLFLFFRRFRHCCPKHRSKKYRLFIDAFLRIT